MKDIYQKRRMISLVLIVIFGFALRMFSYGGVIGTDDASIISSALRLMSDGWFLPESHYSARIGLSVPLAITFKLLGVGEWQLTLLPLTGSVITILLAYEIGKRAAGELVGLLAAFLMAIFPLDVFYSTQYYPDVPLGAMLSLTVFLTLKAGETNKNYVFAIGAGLVWGLAYLIKIEAIFLAPVILVLSKLPYVKWKTVIMVCAVFGSVIIAENLAYFLQSGQVLYRLRVISAISGVTDPEYSMSQLWIFPKAWFITFYEVGIYYYFLLPSVAWALWRRDGWSVILVVWTGVFILWLQFGGNPFNDVYSVKSHLVRYLNVVNVPLCVLVAYFLYVGMKGRVRSLGVLLILATSFFFINLNTLNLERHKSIKIAAKHLIEHNLFPIYADHYSEPIVSFLLLAGGRQTEVFSAQEHDFSTAKTALIDPERMEGYLILSREGMDFGQQRYYMEPYDIEKLKRELDTEYVVSNPGNSLAYLQARLLSGVAELLPSERLKNKIQGTAEYMLEPEDVMVFQMRGAKVLDDEIDSSDSVL